MIHERPNCQLPGDQVGPWVREHHLLETGFRTENGAVLLPQGTGLGVSIDRDILHRYTLWNHTFTRD
jgi:L-alanine-DL-glutamate epimerase-like enolase superfamily enzyme